MRMAFEGDMTLGWVNRIGTKIWCIQQLEEGWRWGVMNGTFVMMDGEYFCFFSSSSYSHIYERAGYQLHNRQRK